MAGSAPIQVLVVVGKTSSSRALQEFLVEIPDFSLVDAATSEQEAMERLSDSHVDVVLIDLGSQDVDRIHLTRQIRHSHPNVRVLISTSSNSPADIFAAMDAGADGYVLRGNRKGLEVAIRSIRLNAVWLDPGIATQVLEVMASTSTPLPNTRTLPTGLFRIPLLPDEKELLDEVAHSNCVDGVCMVDPSFVSKLRQLAAS